MRRGEILSWAKTADDEVVRATAARMAAGRDPRPPAFGPAEEERSAPLQLSLQTAAVRTLFYRRVLAAWQFLLAVNEHAALAQLRELSQLERTPFSRPT